MSVEPQVERVEETTAPASAGQVAVSSQPAARVPELVITPPGRFSGVSSHELWEYRELLYFLTKRELQIRYKQSYLGFSWAILQPAALTLIFAIFFGRIADLPTGGVPYPIFALAGLVPWIFVSGAVSGSANSLVVDANLLGKVYFPRLVIPLAKILALVVDLVAALSFLAIFMLGYDVSLRWTALMAPAFLLLAFATALGAGVYLSALNVRYRDVVVVVPLLIQVWLFLSPVVYAGTSVTGAWAYLYALNPLATVLTGMRWALLGSPAPEVGPALVSVSVALLVLVAAGMYFRRVETFFADVI